MNYSRVHDHKTLVPPMQAIHYNVRSFIMMLLPLQVTSPVPAWPIGYIFYGNDASDHIFMHAHCICDGNVLTPASSACLFISAQYMLTMEQHATRVASERVKLWGGVCP